MDKPPEHSVIYLALVEVHGEETERRYVGQTKNGHRRIILQHCANAYRDSDSKFLYFLMNRADSTS